MGLTTSTGAPMPVSPPTTGWSPTSSSGSSGSSGSSSSGSSGGSSGSSSSSSSNLISSAAGLTRDSAGNVYDANGNKLSLSQFKGQNGGPASSTNPPVVNLTTLPLRTTGSTGSTTPTTPTTGGTTGGTTGTASASYTPQYGTWSSDMYMYKASNPQGTWQLITKTQYNSNAQYWDGQIASLKAAGYSGPSATLPSGTTPSPYENPPAPIEEPVPVVPPTIPTTPTTPTTPGETGSTGTEEGLDVSISEDGANVSGAVVSGKQGSNLGGSSLGGDSGARGAISMLLSDPDFGEIAQIYRDNANNFGVINAQGQRRQLSGAGPGSDFQGLGINETFVAPGSTVSLKQAQTGRTDGALGPAAPPAQSTPETFIQTWEKIIKELGLPTIKEQYEDIQEQFSDLQIEKSEKISDINEDPWLTEGVRVMRVNALTERYKAQEAILASKIDIYQSLYNQGVSQAQYLVTGTMAQQEYLANLALKQAEAQNKLVTESPAQFKEIQGGLYDVINKKWIVGPKPETPTGVNATQEMAAKLQSVAGTDGYVNPKDYQIALNAWVASGRSASSFHSSFSNFRNPKDKYNTGTGAGGSNSIWDEVTGVTVPSGWNMA